MLFLGYTLFLLMGGTFGLIGAGGSILSMPILIYFIGLNPITSVSYAFYVVGIVAFFGAFKYFKKGLIDKVDVISFAIPSSIGVIVSRYFVLPLVPNDISGLISKENLIILLFSIFMIASAVLSLKKKKEEVLIVKEKSFIKNIISALLIGLIVGMLGAGGGFLIIPALHNFLKLEMKKTVGTSLAIVSMNSFIAIITDFSAKSSNIDITILLPILCFALIGMALGLKFESKVKGGDIKKIFAIFTFFIAIIMLVKTFIFN